MANRVIFLGTGAAVANAEHENAHLLVQAGKRMLLIDCPANPIPRAHRIGIDLTHDLTDLALTHFHADHISGLVVMLQTAWLLGRKQALTIHGLEWTLDRAGQMLALFEPESWPGMFPVNFKSVAEAEMQPMIDDPELCLYSSPGRHLIPNIGLRIEFPTVGKVAAYSSDTEPCGAIARLAHGVDVLIHETAGASRGHSSAAQAGEIARRAEAKALYLIHYQTWERDPQPLIAEAQQAFGGPVTLSQDGMEIDLDH